MTSLESSFLQHDEKFQGREGTRGKRGCPPSLYLGLPASNVNLRLETKLGDILRLRSLFLPVLETATNSDFVVASKRRLSF